MWHSSSFSLHYCTDILTHGGLQFLKGPVVPYRREDTNIMTQRNHTAESSETVSVPTTLYQPSSDVLDPKAASKRRKLGHAVSPRMILDSQGMITSVKTAPGDRGSSSSLSSSSESESGSEEGPGNVEGANVIPAPGIMPFQTMSTPLAVRASSFPAIGGNADGEPRLQFPPGRFRSTSSASSALSVVASSATSAISGPEVKHTTSEADAAPGSSGKTYACCNTT